MKLSILPGSLWLAYYLSPDGITNLSSMIPAQTRLVSSRLTASRFVGDENWNAEHPLLLFNAYKISSKFMVGNRIDIQTIVQDVITQKKHLVILDVLTDTLDWNPQSGIRLPNTRFRSVMKRKNNDLRFEYQAKRGKQKLRLGAVSHSDAYREIDYRFAVEANLQCFYRSFPTAYSMDFDHRIVSSPVRIMETDYLENPFWRDERSTEPPKVFLHEHAMEFDVDVQNPFW